ncbi:PRTRC system protein B [Flavobacterium zepuense]|uniref:PRTRC system protein B n=1 Tax=Flavobacterium zepuense TaxID=2593302 RepID=A0A552UUU9_9FLAO|nr:PRTRC system protein B [Flavobacterium zepuense]TRW21979.1 PRTRC system protein B [Flavobacterium zepuense]
MKNITENFGSLYRPVKAFMVYENKQSDAGNNMYVEGYDMDSNGYPVNAHPLSLTESSQLANALDASSELKRNFLKPKGLLPKNILYINPDHKGFALWHTQKQYTNLYFDEALTIPSGKVAIPALLWKASKTTLKIFALADDSAINEMTPLYKAPFFNIHEDGRVCMGTVKIAIQTDCMLEEFIEQWQRYFFESYFSHVIGGQSPVKGNIIQLWQSLAGTKKHFPTKALIKKGITLKQLLQ